MRNIYFAGSIRGGREDAEIYRRMIGHIKKTDIVLTEHIGSPTVESDEKGSTDRDIYIQDTTWLRSCDLVIAECTHPSLGVGYELAFAEALGKPCYILYNCDKSRLSAMLSGDDYYKIYPYKCPDEVFDIIDSILAE